MAEPENLTPSGLMKLVRDFREKNERVIFCHPVRYDAVIAWLDGETDLANLVEVIPTPYLEPNKIIIVPAHVLDKPNWM